MASRWSVGAWRCRPLAFTRGTGAVLRIGPTLIVIPQLACFNLLDSRTVLQRDGFLGSYDATATPTLDQSPSFNAVAATLSSRAYRAGIRIEF